MESTESRPSPQGAVADTSGGVASVASPLSPESRPSPQGAVADTCGGVASVASPLSPEHGAGGEEGPTREPERPGIVSILLRLGLLGDDRRAVILRRRVLPAALFLATIASTVYVGGPAFSATLLAILVSHEMGHYLVARHHGVPASLPYFIPLPVSFLGTMGAIIGMRTDEATRNELMDIGAAGPIAGFVVAVPALIAGIILSHPIQLEGASSALMLGDSLLSWLLTQAFGPVLPPGWDLEVHPVMMAGWAGFLVTSINLIPIGQLDGGHVLYAWHPDRAEVWMRRVHRAVVGLGTAGAVVHGALGLASALEGTAWSLPHGLVDGVRPLVRFFTPGLLLIALLTWRIGLRHPPVRELDRPLTPLRKGLAAACLFILICTFMPNPAWPSEDEAPRVDSAAGSPHE